MAEMPAQMRDELAPQQQPGLDTGDAAPTLLDTFRAFQREMTGGLADPSTSVTRELEILRDRLDALLAEQEPQAQSQAEEMGY
ncbi:MAG TPA: hypothetical protein VLQ80_29285 [Candidatus Saccharimonadia bacterium]|nr:hypothetical protein [Candidatus Saccharimonadia bacterium]